MGTLEFMTKWEEWIPQNADEWGVVMETAVPTFLIVSLATLLGCFLAGCQDINNRMIVKEDSLWTVHDSTHGVTCYINRLIGGGISCLPDSQVMKP